MATNATLEQSHLEDFLVREELESLSREMETVDWMCGGEVAATQTIDDDMPTTQAVSPAWLVFAATAATFVLIAMNVGKI